MNGAPDGVAPERIDRPESESELAAALASARAQGQSVLPLGAGTRAPHGPPPARVPRVLSTLALDRIVTWEPGDQTLRVQAGMRTCDLDARLAEQRQMLPLQRGAGGGTVGGLLATAADGCCELGYGRVRDRVLGCTLALADGRLVRGRGHVVKNVAGYDIPRLMVGSHGTLGVLVEVSFKLEPRPAAQGSARLRFAGLPAAFAAARAVFAAGLEPVFANVLADAADARSDVHTGARGGASSASGAAAGSDLAAELVLGFDGSPARVRGSLDALAAVLAPHAPESIDQLSPEADAALRTRLDEPAAMRASEAPAAAEPIVLRCAVPPDRLCGLARGLVSAAQHGTGTLRVDARPGLGLAFVSLDAPDEARRASLAAAALHAARAMGHATVLAAPAALRASLDCWGPPPPDLPLMRRIKAALDPDGVLLSGRFVGGL